MLFSLPLLFQAAHAPQAVRPKGAIDAKCGKTECTYLVVQSGKVIDLTPLPGSNIQRRVVVGEYDSAAKSLVPPTEAPIRALATPTGWRLVVSASLDVEVGEAGLRIRVLAPDGRVAASDSGDELLTLAKIGPLFAGSDQFAAVCQSAVHPWTDQCRIWWLRPDGTALKVFDFQGRILNFGAGPDPGIWTEQTTHLNDDPYRTLTTRDFWRWNPQTGFTRQTAH